MTNTSRPSRPVSTRMVRAAVVVAAAAAVGAAASAQAAPARCTTAEGQRVETLHVAVARVPVVVSSREWLTAEVHVTRSAADTVGVRDRVRDATVAVRLTGGGTTTHVWGHTGADGIAVLRLSPRAGTPVGAATLAAEAWAVPDTPLECGGTVEEHGLVEHATEVSA